MNDYRFSKNTNGGGSGGGSGRGSQTTNKPLRGNPKMLKERFETDNRKIQMCEDDDLHEMLKLEMANQGTISAFAGSSTDQTQIQNITNNNDVVREQNNRQAETSKQQKNQQYDNGIEDYSFYFDSYYKDSSVNGSSGNISFSINNINNNQPLQNVIQIQIERIYFPVPPTPIGAAELLYFKQVFLQITNIPTTQSVLSNNNIAHHFEFDVGDTNSLATILTPTISTLSFTRPITTLDYIYLKFTIPPLFKSLPIPNDQMAITLIPNGTAYTTGTASQTAFTVTGVGVNFTQSMIGETITFGTAQTAVITAFVSSTVLTVNVSQTVALTTLSISNTIATFSIGLLNTTADIGPIGLLTTPVNVYINAPSTPDATFNNAINSTYGVKITNILSTQTFQIASLSAAGVVAATGNMIIGKNRLAFRLRFTCVTSSQTNYLSANRL